ncbi:hypothetical protein K490DRAFT_67960 [Saccharata proteae CBS 121410]|uniref:Uncharacterized protein n=1 Tax=Saccharata proteae CBS 121410 TaxID=1314787 RepID=A0A9P4HRF0_9PEZI|nr:hypothetical protein K490DRAFT_67960 [Saccharata proteae CBS 121410]
MVTFYRCGDVTAAELEATARWIWSDADKVHDRNADMSRVFCARCAQSIACGRECDRSQLPTWMHGRIVRVTTLKAEYEVRKSMASEDDADELAVCYQIALDCSSAQRELTRELQHYRDSVNNNGGLFDGRTSRPRSNVDFMQLQLIAQREGNELSQVRNEELRAAREQTERVRIHDNYYILDADCAVTAESWHATVACCRLGTIWQRQGQGPES